MNTPIWDFVKNYSDSGFERFHMPGHKGVPGLVGPEKYDITEINGAGSLYQTSGIIRESEENAASIFGSARTLYSTEGSSQCIKAMLYLAVTLRRKGSLPLVVAARNVHTSFINAAALIGFDVKWLWPEKDTPLASEDITNPICQDDSNVQDKFALPKASFISFPVRPTTLQSTLKALKDTPPCAVYITSPDYLGYCQDLKALSKVCDRYKVPLLVDNAHGAYLKFSGGLHPLDCDADMCCDSAHKTLPVLTGGAYLHISKKAPEVFIKHAKKTMALFGSTSPSYLALCSLDLCNKYLSGDLPGKIRFYASLCSSLKTTLRNKGLLVPESDPLRIVICGDGKKLSFLLRKAKIEPEYVSKNAVVCMITPLNKENFSDLLLEALENETFKYDPGFLKNIYEPSIPEIRPRKVMSIRDAIFSSSETLKASDALGRVSSEISVKCPPGIALAAPGELIDEALIRLFKYYDIQNIDVVISQDK